MVYLSVERWGAVRILLWISERRRRGGGKRGEIDVGTGFL